MNRRFRPQFGMKTMLLGVLAITVLMMTIHWFCTDTIFYTDTDSTLQLPRGHTLATNRWIFGGETLAIGLLATDRKNEFLMIQNQDNSNVAILRVSGAQYEAIVTEYNFRGPKYRGEYWLRPGKRIAL